MPILQGLKTLTDMVMRLSGCDPVKEGAKAAAHVNPCPHAKKARQVRVVEKLVSHRPIINMLLK